MSKIDEIKIEKLKATIKHGTEELVQVTQERDKLKSALEGVVELVEDLEPKIKHDSRLEEAKQALKEVDNG